MQDASWGEGLCYVTSCVAGSGKGSWLVGRTGLLDILPPEDLHCHTVQLWSKEYKFSHDSLISKTLSMPLSNMQILEWARSRFRCMRTDLNCSAQLKLHIGGAIHYAYSIRILL